MNTEEYIVTVSTMTPTYGYFGKELRWKLVPFLFIYFFFYTVYRISQDIIKQLQKLPE